MGERGQPIVPSVESMVEAIRERGVEYGRAQELGNFAVIHLGELLPEWRAAELANQTRAELAHEDYPARVLDPSGDAFTATIGVEFTAPAQAKAYAAA